MLRNKRIILLLITAIMLHSCFKAYEPEIAGTDATKLVVSGVVTDLGGDQKVSISMSSSFIIQLSVMAPLRLCCICVP